MKAMAAAAEAEAQASTVDNRMQSDGWSDRCRFPETTPKTPPDDLIALVPPLTARRRRLTSGASIWFENWGCRAWAETLGNWGTVPQSLRCWYGPCLRLSQYLEGQQAETRSTGHILELHRKQKISDSPFLKNTFPS